MSCIFCEIIAKKIPAEIVFEDDHLLAFRDLNPQAPVHILLIPKKHISGLDRAEETDRELLGRLAAAAARIAEEEGIGKTGFRLVVNSGPAAGQEIDHLHFHLLGGRKMSWPPG